MLVRVGYHAVTFEGVADRAGVARTSIYRRYDDIAELVTAAVEDVLAVPAPPADQERPEAWQSIVRSLRAALIDSDVGLPLLASLLVADHEQPELLELWRARVIQPRIERIASVLAVDPEDAQLLGELAFGGLIARHVARGHVSDTDADEFARLLTNGVPSLDEA